MALSPILPIAALALSIALHFAALKVFPMLGLLDFPERYGLKRPRLPYPTGIIAVLLFLAIVPWIGPFGMKEWGLVTAVAALGMVSFIDDRTPLPFWLRLSLQIILCALLFATGSRIYTITNPLGGIIKMDSWNVAAPFFGTLPIASGVFTILWLTLTMNAMNWFDGIPGQVSALSAVGFLMLGSLALFRDHQPAIALIAFVLLAISLGAIPFDFPPGKVVIGDTGSMFFGLLLGLIGIYDGGKVATAFLVLGIPLFDAIFVIIERLLKGSSPFKGNHDHLHHLLKQRGWDDRSIVLLNTSIGLLFGGAALFLSTAEKGVALAILFVVVFGLRRYARTPTSRTPLAR